MQNDYCNEEDMFELVLSDFDAKFPGKEYLTLAEVATALDCPKRVIYNWVRRPDPSQCPPLVQNGKWIRIPKRIFARWLSKIYVALNDKK